uniref:SH3 domain binding glutamate rich protein like n=1 Tax=Nothoprocta perdicaria TaxID=30464 RepID=A0A8C6ZU18_NOTPE
MRENVPEDSRPASGNPLPPRLFNDSRYLGDYEAFFEARENNAVYAFLGLTAPPGSKVGPRGGAAASRLRHEAGREPGHRSSPAFPCGAWALEQPCAPMRSPTAGAAPHSQAPCVHLAAEPSTSPGDLDAPGPSRPAGQPWELRPFLAV